MKTIIKNLISSVGFGQMVVGFGALGEEGWWKSFWSRRPVRKSGDPLPWFSYAAIDFLEKGRIPKTVNVFEYGCGYSSVWWAKYATSVVSVEHDKSFAEEIGKIIPSNCEIYLEEDINKYVNRVEFTGKKWNIVVIDGLERQHCCSACIEHLATDGVVVWDNFERTSAEDIQPLVDAGFRLIEFRSFGPLNGGPWSTTIFYRDANCLGI